MGAMNAPRAHRILAVTDGNYLSHTTRTLEIAKRLRDAGDEVRFAASGRYTRVLDEAGFERQEIHTLSPAHVMDYTRRSRMDYYSAEQLEACVQADLAAIAWAQPDLVLGDFRWSLSISGQIAKVPYVSILNTLWTHYYALSRTVPEGFVLRRLIGERMVATVGSRIKNTLLWIWGRTWNHVRKNHGLSPRPNLVYHFYGDLDLLPDIVSLFPTHPLPCHVHRIGPIFWKGGVTSEPGKLPPRSDRPLVYASIGSTGTDLFLQKLFAGFGDQEVDVVLSTGGQPLPCAPPANFYCLDIVAAEDVLPRAVLAVCHGGNGTVYQCLSYGVPLLGIATHNDQQWNLDRVAATGVGWRFTQKRVEPAELRACLRAVLDNPGWRQRAGAMAAEICATDGPGEAAAAICDLL